MKFLRLIVVGLLYGPALLRAQPVSDPVPMSGEQHSTADDSASGGDGSFDLEAPDKPWSQGVSLESRKAAQALFMEGNRLFKIPLFAKAAEKYAAALDKWKHPAIYLNLAIAQINSGQEVEAYSNLERALQHGKEPFGEEQFHEIQQQLEDVKRQLSRIRVTCRLPGAAVTLDGVLLFIGPGSYEGWVKAKDHDLTAKKPEYLPEARRVTVVPGQFQNIELKLVTLSEAADASRRWAVWKPWAVVVAGGAIVATGSAFHALAYRNFKEYDRAFHKLLCATEQSSPGCRENEPELLDRPNLAAQLKLANREWTVALGAYIAGGSLVATGIVLLYLNRPQFLEQRNEHSSGRRVAIVPIISNEAFGVLMDIRY